MSDFCIIGSGPSAITAAVALTRRNFNVTMLDAGRVLEDSRREHVDRMSALQPRDWKSADTQRLREGIEATAQGIPLRRLYGSGFPFSTDGTSFDVEMNRAELRPSFAQGGLSTVWGAGMLPFHPDDLEDWPFPPAELDAGYRNVFSFVPCCGAHDNLETWFPLYASEVQSLPPTSQAQAFLNDARRAQGQLERAGFRIGQSRLAVDGRACRHCGMCLYGCPYEAIYNSAFTLRQLRRLPNFKYEPNFVVERLQENNGAVRIGGHDLATQSPRTFEAGRVLLGAGVISTTAILLASLDEFDVKIRLMDSFYFLLPMLRFSGVSNLEREELHTLAQAFIVLRDPDVCREFVHFSLYGLNDLMVPSIRISAGVFGRVPFAPFWNALAARSLVLGGYLHSRLSPGLTMKVFPGKDDRGFRIHLNGEDSESAKAIARKAAVKLRRQWRHLRALALLEGIRFSVPGRGFHAGGSFPMRRERTPHTSDVAGRPFGFDRVHILDASCFPSIPATTITLPIMANAWRIAERAGNWDQ